MSWNPHNKICSNKLSKRERLSSGRGIHIHGKADTNLKSVFQMITLLLKSDINNRANTNVDTLKSS